MAQLFSSRFRQPSCRISRE